MDRRAAATYTVSAAMFGPFIICMLLRLLTFNVQGFKSVRKQTEVVQFARAARCDLLFLQETNFGSPKEREEFRARFCVECYFSFSHGRCGGGVGVVIFNRALLNHSFRMFDTQGRVISLDFYWCKKKYRVVNVYAPATPSLCNEFFRGVDCFLLNPSPTILLGDFNCFLDTNRDIRGPGQGREDWTGRELRRIVQHFSLVDAWTHLHGDEFQHTRQLGKTATRLDRVYVAKALVGAVQGCSALDMHSTPVHISDHRPVYIDIKGGDMGIPAAKTWRLDNRILLDPVTREALAEQLTESLKAVTPDATSWDGLKGRWREHCEGAARAWRRLQNARLWDVVCRVRIVLRGGPLTPLMKEYLAELQRRYERLLRMSSAAGTATWNRTGPQAHPEVLRMAEQTLVRDRQPPVVGDADVSGTDDPAMLSRFSAHFAALARSEGTAVGPQEFVRFLPNLPAIPPETAQTLVSPPTAEEVFKALRHMKTGVSPGPDGLTVEFYKTYWSLLQEHLVQMVRKAVLGEEVPTSFGQGRVVLLPKEGGDRGDPNSWRPVTLLNTDYKLVARIVCARLQRVLPEVVCPWQVSSVPGRSIFAAAALTRDLIEYTRARSARGMLVSLDQSKAFDRIEHAYLFAVLEAFGVPQETIMALRKLYGGMTSELVVNGRVVSSFPVTRGVRQGCPLSPVLFILSLDPFLVKIAKDPWVRGLPMPGSERAVVMAYADDITLYLEDVDSVHRVFKLFEEYALVSGARLNHSKSKALRLGGVYGPLPQVAWGSHVTILGITYNSTGLSCITWNNIETEMEKKIEMAKSYNLPLAEKRYVAQTILCGRLWYAARVGVPPAAFVTRVQRQLNSFFLE